MSTAAPAAADAEPKAKKKAAPAKKGASKKAAKKEEPAEASAEAPAKVGASASAMALTEGAALADQGALAQTRKQTVPVMEPRAKNLWYWKDDAGSWVQYRRVENMQIDEAFTANQEEVSVTVATGASQPQTYAVNFVEMVQKHSETGHKRQIKRESLALNEGRKRQHTATAPAVFQRSENPDVLPAPTSYDSEKAKCVEKYRSLLETCVKEDKKFEDPEFPPGPWALWVDPAIPQRSDVLSHPTVWKRASEISPGATLWGQMADQQADQQAALKASVSSQRSIQASLIDTADIEQGALGSCFLLGPLAAAAQRPELVKKMFIAHNVDACIYAVAFYFNQKWVWVIVDDFIPCNAFGVPLYAFSKDKRKLWVPLLEKAYAKLHRCYANVNGGVESYAMIDLLGTASNRIALKEPKVVADIKSGRLWQYLFSRARSGCILSCSLDSPDGTPFSEVDGSKLVQIYNPHGKETWNGKWSDRDPVWITRPELRQRLNFKMANDGVFWMEWGDFCQNWSNINVGLTFDYTWSSTTVYGFWDFGTNPDGDMCGGERNWARNPQYALTIKESCTVVITLSQPSTKAYEGEDSYFFGIGLRLCLTTRTGRWRIVDPLECITLSETPVLLERSVCLEVLLDPQQDSYAVVVCTDKPGIVAPFCLTVHASKPFDLRDQCPQSFFASKLEGQAVAAGYVDIFDEWYHSMRPRLIEGTASHKAVHGRATEQRIVFGRSETERLVFAKNSRYDPLVSQLLGSRPGAVLHELTGAPAWLAKLLDRKKAAAEPHVCSDGICIDMGGACWRELCVTVVGNVSNRAREPKTIADERRIVAPAGEKLIPATLEGIWALLEDQKVYDNREYVRELQFQGAAKEWKTLAAFESLFEVLKHPPLRLRVVCALPPPVTLELLEGSQVVQGEGASISIGWKIPEFSKPSLAPTNFKLTVVESTADGVQIGKPHVFDIEPPKESVRLSVTGLKISRCFNFHVAGQNAVGIGENSDQLHMTSTDLISRACINKFGSHKTAVLSVAYGGEPPFLYTGSRDLTITKWTLAPTRAAAMSFTGHTGAVYCLALHAKGLFSGSEDRTIRLWDTSAGKCVTTLKSHFSPVVSLCSTADGLLFSGSADGSVAVWDIESLACRFVISCTAAPTSMYFLGPATLYIGLDNGMIQMTALNMEKQTHKVEATFALHPGAVSAISISPPNMYSACLNGHLRCWNYQQKEECRWDKKVHRGPIYGMFLSGAVIFTASFDGSLAIVDAAKGTTITRIPMPFGPLHCLHTIEEPLCVYIGSASGSVLAIDVPPDAMQVSSQPSSVSVTKME
eukprot:m51a1_g1542 putative calpain-like protein (1311) ;mRNA; f:550526-555753